jgi:hypothetical protein
MRRRDSRPSRKSYLNRGIFMTINATNYQGFPLTKIDSQVEDFEVIVDRKLTEIDEDSSDVIRIEISSEPTNRLHLVAAKRLADKYSIGQALGPGPLFSVNSEVTAKGIDLVFKPLGE